MVTDRAFLSLAPMKAAFSSMTVPASSSSPSLANPSPRSGRPGCILWLSGQLCDWILVCLKSRFTR